MFDMRPRGDASIEHGKNAATFLRDRDETEVDHLLMSDQQRPALKAASQSKLSGQNK